MTGIPVLDEEHARGSVSLSRLSPVPGRVLVQSGDEVHPELILAEADLTPGVRWTVPASEQLALSPSRLPEALLVRPGDRVQRSDALAEVAGRPKRICRSPVTGVVEQIDFVLGQLKVRETGAQLVLPIRISVAEHLGCSRRDLPALIHRCAGATVRRGELLAGSFPGPLLFAPVTGTLQKVDCSTGEIAIAPARELWRLPAAVPGVVDSIIPNQGCVLRSRADTFRGLCRLGGEAYGRLRTVAAARGRLVEPEQITGAMAGQVVVISSLLTGETLHQAQVQGVSAIVAGGAHLSALLQAVGISRLASALQAESLGISVLLLAGFGDAPMHEDLFSRLESLAGRHAFISGQQPELLVFHRGRRC